MVSEVSLKSNTIHKLNQYFSRNWKRIIMYVLVVLIPVVITFSLLQLTIGSSLSHSHPFWTDEVDYWMQINSYKEHGFDSGNFTVNELTSNSSRSHYGTHGPFFPMFMGLLARIFGWFDYSAPYYNLAFLCLALIIFIWLTKPDIKQSFLVIFVFSFFYFIHFYIPTTMQETLNFAISIVYAGLLIRLVVFKDHHLLIYISLILLVFFASLLRVIWVLAIFPVFYFLFTKQGTSIRKVLASIMASIAFSLLSSYIYIKFTSPFPIGNFYHLVNNYQGLSQALLFLKGNILGNLAKLFAPYGLLAKTDIFVRYSYLAILLVFCVQIKRQPKLSLSTLFIMLSTLLLTIVVYDVGNFRILAAYLLIGMLMLVFGDNQVFTKNVITIYVLFGLIVRSQFITDYKNLLQARFYVEGESEYTNFKKDLENVVHFENANSWCNTLLTSRVYSPELRYIPAGIGTSILLDREENNFAIDFADTDIKGQGIQSHYLLVSEEFLERYGLTSKCQIIGEYENDVLCVRIDDNCP